MQAPYIDKLDKLIIANEFGLRVRHIDTFLDTNNNAVILSQHKSNNRYAVHTSYVGDTYATAYRGFDNGLYYLTLFEAADEIKSRLEKINM